MLILATALLAAAIAQPASTPEQPAPHDAAPLPQHSQDRLALRTAFGWTNLDNARAWRGYKEQDFPSKGWTVDNGLVSIAHGDGGDLMTREQYGDFEFEFDFKCAPKANSGVMYRATEKHGASWQTGPEYQVIDDAGNSLKPDDAHSSGAIYDIVKPPADKPYRNGANLGRIYVRNGLIKHWLNGKKVAEVEAFNADGTPTDAWKQAIAASKFKEYEGFGIQPKGSIVLQDHGDSVYFRDMRVRALDKPAPGEVKLFNGKDLAGWTAVVPELAEKKEDQTKPWTVEGGVLKCAGNPGGYIRTNEKYTNFVLRLQWRFDPAKGAGNSGVLLRTNGEDKVWPRSIEAQLHSGNAGDFWNIGEMKMGVAPDRTKGRNTRKTHAAERPLGQWNEYEIVCQRGTVQLFVNGELLNSAENCEETPGYICLQSEGAYIEFRDIRLVPLP